LWQVLREENHTVTSASSTGAEKRVAKGRQHLIPGQFRSAARKTRKRPKIGLEYLDNYLILIDFIEWIKKVGADNKPGSVIDNHSSGTAVTDCL